MNRAATARALPNSHFAYAVTNPLRLNYSLQMLLLYQMPNFFNSTSAEASRLVRG